MMFKEQLHTAFDGITPSPELLDKVSAMMAEEAAKTAHKPPIRFTAARYAGIAAAVAIAAGAALIAVNSGGGIDTSNSVPTTAATAAKALVPETGIEETAAATAADVPAPSLQTNEAQERAFYTTFVTTAATEYIPDAAAEEEISNEEEFAPEPALFVEMQDIPAEEKEDVYAEGTAAAVETSSEDKPEPPAETENIETPQDNVSDDSLSIMQIVWDDSGDEDPATPALPETFDEAYYDDSAADETGYEEEEAAGAAAPEDAADADAVPDIAPAAESSADSLFYGVYAEVYKPSGEVTFTAYLPKNESEQIVALARDIISHREITAAPPVTDMYSDAHTFIDIATEISAQIYYTADSGYLLYYAEGGENCYMLDLRDLLAIDEILGYSGVWESDGVQLTEDRPGIWITEYHPAGVGEGYIAYMPRERQERFIQAFRDIIAGALPQTEDISDFMAEHEQHIAKDAVTVQLHLGEDIIVDGQPVTDASFLLHEGAGVLDIARGGERVYYVLDGYYPDLLG